MWWPQTADWLFGSDPTWRVSSAPWAEGEGSLLFYLWHCCRTSVPPQTPHIWTPCSGFLCSLGWYESWLYNSKRCVNICHYPYYLGTQGRAASVMNIRLASVSLSGSPGFPSPLGETMKGTDLEEAETNRPDTEQTIHTQVWERRWGFSEFLCPLIPAKVCFSKAVLIGLIQPWNVLDFLSEMKADTKSTETH